MKKLLALLLIFTGIMTFAFADDFSDEYDEYDDFDDIFLEASEDIVVEESTPVVSTPSSSPVVSYLGITGHFDGNVGLSAVIIDKPDFGGYLDLSNTLYLNVKPSSSFGLHGALATSLSNGFGLGVSYFYFDYMLLDRVFISAGKKGVSWGYTRLFGNCNILADTNGYLNAEIRYPWSTGTATLVASYNYGLLSTSPSYKDISYSFSLEQTIGHTSVNLFAKKYGQSEKNGDVHKHPIAGLEAKRTFFNGYDTYVQGYARLADYKKLNSTSGYENLTATAGFYKLWDGFDPNLGINIEYQYVWVPGAAQTQGSVHNHEIFVQGGIKRIGKNKNMKGAVECIHNFNSKSGSFTAGFIIDGLFPYASWKNGVQVDYSSSGKPKFTIGTTISISLDY